MPIIKCPVCDFKGDIDTYTQVDIAAEVQKVGDFGFGVECVNVYICPKCRVLFSPK